MTDDEFTQAMDDLMGALVDAGFSNVSTSATLGVQCGELSLFGDEAARLLRIVRHGLVAERTARYAAAAKLVTLWPGTGA